MNSKELFIITILLSVVLIMSILFGLYLTNNRNNHSSTSNGVIVDNSNKDSVDDDIDEFSLENVYISQGNGWDLYQFNSTNLSQPVVHVTMDKNTANMLFNSNYTTTLMLKGAMGGKLEDLVCTSNYLSYVETYYLIDDMIGIGFILPNSFVLPEVNTWALSGEYYYDVIIEVVDNNTNKTFTSNMLKSFKCWVNEGTVSGYSIYSINLSINSEQFIESGKFTYSLNINSNSLIEVNYPNTTDKVLSISTNSNDYEILQNLTLNVYLYDGEKVTLLNKYTPSMPTEFVNCFKFQLPNDFICTGYQTVEPSYYYKLLIKVTKGLYTYSSNYLDISCFQSSTDNLYWITNIDLSINTTLY